jgi:hypothetical protein
MSAPAVVVRFELEAAPRLYADATTEAEMARLLDWINAHPDHVDLIDRARELVAHEKAA